MSPSAAPQPAARPGGQTVVLITGIQAAGKSTTAQTLAERLPRTVHLPGDVFRRMIVTGRAEMTPDPTDEAICQLRLRYRLTAEISDAYLHSDRTRSATQPSRS